MAFTSAVTKTFPLGVGTRFSFGTFTNGASDSGGDVDTGLTKADAFFAGYTSHFNSGNVKVSLSAGTATIVTDDGADGYWIAIGV